MSLEKDIILDTILEVLEEVAVNDDDFKTVSEFISNLQTYNHNTFFTAAAQNKLNALITDTATVQDTVLDLMVSTSMRLEVNGLSVNDLSNRLYSIANDHSIDSMLPDSLKKQLDIPVYDNTTVSKNHVILYLYRLYGSSVLAEAIGV